MSLIENKFIDLSYSVSSPLICSFLFSVFCRRCNWKVLRRLSGRWYVGQSSASSTLPQLCKGWNGLLLKQMDMTIISYVTRTIITVWQTKQERLLQKYDRSFPTTTNQSKITSMKLLITGFKRNNTIDKWM